MQKDMPDNSMNQYLDIHPDVLNALNRGQPVVALESTIICHGMPYPKNVETANQVECAVREHGSTPATIAILGGRLKVGLDASQIEFLGHNGQNVAKTSRRDIPFVVSRGGDGATTVASTMIIAAMASIRVMATGGIGGVHRGVEQSMDISADLQELSRTNVAVVCAGVKSVLDIGRTLEYLETCGVPVIGYQTDTLPAFYTRDSGFPVDYRIEHPEEVAKIMRTKWELDLGGGMIIANPIPEEYELDPREIDTVIEDALQEMSVQGITGKNATPFLLARIARQTGGRSLQANIQLVLNNAALAGKIANC
jgi:pseudouridine-5'-phosphate glycosidase